MVFCIILDGFLLVGLGSKVLRTNCWQEEGLGTERMLVKSSRDTVMTDSYDTYCWSKRQLLPATFTN